MLNKITSSYIFLLVIIGTLLGCYGSESETAQADRYFQEGNYKKAVEAYSEYLSLKPNNMTVLYNRGRAYEELGQIDKAMADFQEVLENEPENVNALLSVGKNYYREGEFEDAAFQFKDIIKDHPDNLQANFMLARSYHKLGETDEALQQYDNAINIDAEYGEAFLYRGALKINLKRSNAGCSDLQKAKNLGVNTAGELYEQYCQ